MRSLVSAGRGARDLLHMTFALTCDRLLMAHPCPALVLLSAKWRRLLCGSSASLPVRWVCALSPDPLHDDCSYPQEPLPDEDGSEDGSASETEAAPPAGKSSQKSMRPPLPRHRKPSCRFCGKAFPMRLRKQRSAFDRHEWQCGGMDGDVVENAVSLSLSMRLRDGQAYVTAHMQVTPRSERAVAAPTSESKEVAAAAPAPVPVPVVQGSYQPQPQPSRDSARFSPTAAPARAHVAADTVAAEAAFKADDSCGRCAACLDMPRFGGLGTKRKRCQHMRAPRWGERASLATWELAAPPCDTAEGVDVVDAVEPAQTVFDAITALQEGSATPWLLASHATDARLRGSSSGSSAAVAVGTGASTAGPSGASPLVTRVPAAELLAPAVTDAPLLLTGAEQAAESAAVHDAVAGHDSDSEHDGIAQASELLLEEAVPLPLSWSQDHQSKRKKRSRPRLSPGRCRCNRSGCLKRYCICFSAGQSCSQGEFGCRCKGCENDDVTEERRIKRAVEMKRCMEKKKVVGCTCVRTGCVRGYCVCFKANLACTDKCSCTGCGNGASGDADDRRLAEVGQQQETALQALGTQPHLLAPAQEAPSFAPAQQSQLPAHVQATDAEARDTEAPAMAPSAMSEPSSKQPAPLGPSDSLEVDATAVVRTAAPTSAEVRETAAVPVAMPSSESIASALAQLPGRSRGISLNGGKAPVPLPTAAPARAHVAADTVAAEAAFKADDACGRCAACLDMPRFGGLGTKRKRCQHRFKASASETASGTAPVSALAAPSASASSVSRAPAALVPRRRVRPRHQLHLGAGPSSSLHAGSRASCVGIEYQAALPPLLDAHTTAIRAPPADPPLCDCGEPCSWWRSRYYCQAGQDSGGCGFETQVPPSCLPVPLCDCGNPCKWTYDRWWCRRFPNGACRFEHRPHNAEEPTRLERPSLESEAACSQAALLTASAFGLDQWCFVAPSDCGLGLYARSELLKGQAIISYDGPRLPLELIVKGEFVLEVPGQGTAIDAACENVTYALAAEWPLSPAMRANHSRRPNVALEHWPARDDGADHLVLVARERIPAGAEVRFDYEKGGRPGTYWGRRQAPPETRWRQHHRHPPPPTCDEPVIDYLPQLLASRNAAFDSSHGSHGSELLPPLPHFLLPSSSPSPRPWTGPHGGDEVLRHVIEQVQRTQWLQDLVRRGEGKARLWQLVATHLPGRSQQECQQRWRSLHKHEHEQ